MYTVHAYIDKNALRQNLRTVKKLAPDSKVMVMLKANAYGHGIIEVAETCTEADIFGVARLHEAVQLRNAGIDKRVLLLEGFVDEADLAPISSLGLEVVVHQLWQVETLERGDFIKPIEVWIKVNTGMHRLGFFGEQLSDVFQRLSSLTSVRNPIHLMSHLSSADDLESMKSLSQISRFELIGSFLREQGLGGDLSLANSLGLIRFPQSHFDIVRPGIMIYGASDTTELDVEQLPVMTLTSKVIAINDLPPNEPLGYGETWSSSKKTKIAVVAIGYGDGYPRHATNGTPVFINGKVFPLVGRVSMDMITVDIGDSEVKVGDTAELWGKNLSISTVANYSATIAYTLLCCLTNRVKFHYVDTY